MPPVKFFGRLDLDQICLFPDGHYLLEEAEAGQAILDVLLFMLPGLALR